MSSEAAEPAFAEGITFLAAVHCPYAQRSWIALNAKGVDFETLLIDLSNKPPWFFKYNPAGRVPTVVFRDDEGVHSLYESLIVNEFINDLPGRALLPTHPAKRAHARLIIDRFGNAGAGAVATILFNKDPAALPAKLDKLHEELTWLESQISEEGPYFLGPEFSLVDAAIIPFLLRIPVLEEVTGTQVMNKYPKLQEWVDYSKAVPAVTESFRTADPSLPYEEDLRLAELAFIKSFVGK